MNSANVIQFKLREILVEFAAERHELAAAIKHIYSPFSVECENDVSGSLSIRSIPSVSAWRASVDGKEFSFDDFNIALWTLEDAVAERLLQAASDCLLIHAAAVSDGERTILLVGPSGSGKTTLALQLVRRGWLYITDEFAMIEPSCEFIQPFPRSATRKFDGPKPAGTNFNIHDKFGFRSHLLPDNRSLLSPLEMKSCVIIFPRHQKDSHLTVRSINSAEACSRLMPSIFDFEGHEKQTWPTLANLATKSCAYEFSYRNAANDLSLFLNALE